jgi:pimeloyl-ACP methyl ester carboxylesterase
MPIANVRGANINCEVLGTSGPWVALSPGGRRALDYVKSLARHVADAGYRVLIHDRRNCGVSDIVIGGDQSEYEIWADDLHELLVQLKALPVIVGGSSSGCRLSVLFALKYPQAVRALLLWRVTGGAFAGARLTENYYSKYIRAAQEGGMDAVCALDHFQERIAARPQNRDDLDGHGSESVHRRHGTLARAVRQGRRAADHRRQREGPELHQGPDLHHPRQRQDPQSRRRRGRPPHDPGQRAA